MSAFGRLVDRHARARGMLAMSASGQLGFGIQADAFRAGIARGPDFIGCDMGSIDPGPYYLGSGRMAADAAIAKRDLRLVLTGARQLDIPLLIGSAGTAGAAPHLAATLDLVREIAREDGLHFTLASIAADIAPALVIEARRAGCLHSLGPMPPPSEYDIANSRIVAQMGMAAFERALAAEPDVVIAGRACDTAIYATIPHLLGYPIAEAMHMAKIIECTSLCCVPGGRDSILAHLGMNGFVLESLNPARHATPLSVAAHGLYEQAEPFSVAEPMGRLHLEEARYAAVDAHRTRVSGARFEPAASLRVKIEGALLEGARGVLLAASTDPGFIRELDTILAAVERHVRDIVAAPFRLFPRVYGTGAVSLWSRERAAADEIFLMIECVADTQTEVQGVLTSFRQALLHFGFPGRLCTGGNLAFPITPPELTAGEAYRFSLYHLMDAADEAALFPVRVEVV